VPAGAPSVYIANARLARPDADEPRPGGVLVEGGAIAAVALDGPEPRVRRGARAGEVFDAAGMILMPGLVNAHYHSYRHRLKGTQNRLPLEPWALYTVAYGSALALTRFASPSCSAPRR
jgi:cytosine/adenosine deaminase-related metal-dependent hydrolase